ncbi:tyrosine-type recombinase/integrase [Oryzibacter oryziterrae]|uniref:tyrosine-type recombinase/integrase n=1 Tax=Oryzibacter oryziterrae TaxID=2766474 RepID=UPI001F019EEE|nr:tyrosine-type recombinase/integrase [Oryzibacter oryziterrae]
MAELITKRGGYWHYVRRVPKEYADLDRRGIIFQSTKVKIVDDPRGIHALSAARSIDADVMAYWSALKDGEADEARTRYDAARRRSRQLGFDYTPAHELAGRPLEEIVARVVAMVNAGGSNGSPDTGTTAALLGGISKPGFKLSELFGAYEKLQAATMTDMSEDQVRKWGNPKKRAVANLIGVIGDKSIDRITRSDAIDFRTWWSDRVVNEGVQALTANKDFGHIQTMISAVDEAHRLGLDPVFTKLSFSGGQGGQRVAFDVDFIQSRLLADGALDGLNEEARRIVYLIAETGLRLSEATNLTEETIRLDAKIPHIIVSAEGRRMKTPHSGREIPLVGVALAAMKAQPAGFPRYREKSASLSGVVNKWLAENGLRPVDGQSVYSLRHSFEDRLTAINAPDKIIAVFMGHKHYRPKYGVGPSLALKLEWLEKIALRPPAAV